MTEFTKEELENEVWKDIPEYEGLYQVSDLGRVKSLNYNHTKEERILKPGVTTHGYYKVSLCKNGKKKTSTIHKLVAMAFLNHVPCGHLIEIDHKDENKKNNCLSNLAILTKKEHTEKTFKNKSSQHIGVCFYKSRNKWQAQITIKGQTKNLGRFSTELEAHEAIQKAEEMAKSGDFSFMQAKKYSSQYKGVSFYKQNQKWQAYITISGKFKNLGYFDTELEAHEAVQKAEESAKNGDLSFMKPKEYSSQYTGVSFNKQTQKWEAYITINGQQKYLGLFPTELEAHEAVQKSLNELK